MHLEAVAPMRECCLNLLKDNELWEALLTDPNYCPIASRLCAEAKLATCRGTAPSHQQWEGAVLAWPCPAQGSSPGDSGLETLHCLAVFSEYTAT